MENKRTKEQIQTGDTGAMDLRLITIVAVVSTVALIATLIWLSLQLLV